MFSLAPPSASKSKPEESPTLPFCSTSSPASFEFVWISTASISCAPSLPSQVSQCSWLSPSCFRKSSACIPSRTSFWALWSPAAVPLSSPSFISAGNSITCASLKVATGSRLCDPFPNSPVSGFPSEIISKAAAPSEVEEALLSASSSIYEPWRFVMHL